VVVIVTALAFDFTNGFHDTANAMATSIATRALSPRVTVGLSAVLNFAGAFISIAVATTIAEDIVAQDLLALEVLFAGLLGAIMWNLLTWALGLPSSSSHALIGGSWVLRGWPEDPTRCKATGCCPRL
jgi:PiT family inorganic phosphate transporter